MSFVGALPAEMRKWLAKQAAVFADRTVAIGCSGSFAVEHVLSLYTDAQIYSNDVSLYSSVLGNFFADQEFALELTDERFAFIDGYLKESATKAAAIVALSGIIKFADCKNEYQTRMWTHALQKIDAHISFLAEKLDKLKKVMRIKRYTMEDCYDFYSRPWDISVCYPPTYVGGYERMFKKLESAFEWAKPVYQKLTEERREEMLLRCTRGDYILWDDKEYGLPIVSMLAKKGRRKVYCFSNLNTSRDYLQKKNRTKSFSVDFLLPEQKIAEDDKIYIRQLDGTTIDHLRSLFLSKKIVYSGSGINLGFFAGNKLFGAAIYLPYSVKTKKSDQIYLLSDFCVPSIAHKRLAKLVLLCCTSRDVQQLLESKEIKKYRSLLTTVFTNQPVSMKYRGIFSLEKRKQDFLQYRSDFKKHSLQEALAIWKKKYDKS